MRRNRREQHDTHDVAELAALADSSLASDRRAALEARVAASPDLAGRLAEQRRAIALLQWAADETEAPAGLRARVQTQRPRRRFLPAPRPLALAGAAAVAAAVAVGVAVVGSGSSGTRFHAALAPTALAPRARGGVTISRTPAGWRIHLEASGLPRLAGGRFSEAWLLNPAGVLVPVGTFNEGRGVTLWAGVPPTRFTTLTVTRERADGDQASSGERVLVGSIRTG